MTAFIEILPAFNGDATLIKLIEKNIPFNIIIDGGIRETYENEDEEGILKKRIKELLQNKEKIDLLVITHIDDDHIAGILAFVEDAEIDKSIVQKYWFNSSKIISKYFNTQHSLNREVKITLTNTSNKISVQQGKTLEKFLETQSNKWHSSPILFKDETTKEKIISNNTYSYNNFKLILLSPTKKELRKLNVKWVEKSKKISNAGEKDDRKLGIKDIDWQKTYYDNDIANKSSIAFYLTYKSKNYLFLADAAHTIITKTLKKLGFSKKNKFKAEFVKLSHHGSKYNISQKLLELIDCEHFIISTDGIVHKHPNKYTLALIINHYNQLGKTVHFYFNQNNTTLQALFSKADKNDKQLKFKTHFPEQGKTLKFELQ